MSDGETSAIAQNVHAVLWRGPGGVVPDELARALAGRDIAWQEAAGPFDAFARVAAARGEHPARVLLLVEPEGLPGVEGVLRALGRFDPGVGVWAFREADVPRLRPFGLPPAPTEPEVVVRPVPRPSSGNGLRLVGEEPAAAGPAEAATDDAGAADGDREPQSPRSMLTPEELEMLLADDLE